MQQTFWELIRMAACKIDVLDWQETPSFVHHTAAEQLRRRISLLVSSLAIASSPLLAQEPASPRDSCDGRMVSTISIQREPPPLLGKSAPRWARPILRAVIQHRTTKPSAIEPFLLLEEGKPCTEFLQKESERLLRAQPYLANATVRTETDSIGGTRVHVETVDEIPLVIGARLRKGELAGLKYGSSNFRGEGVYGSLEWRRGFAYREGVSARYVNYHIFGNPDRLTVRLDRASLSSDYMVALERPFLTSHQSVAWHVGFRDADRYTSFVRYRQEPLALAVGRTRFDLGGVKRIGRPESGLFAGPFITYERIQPATSAVVITDTGFATDGDSTLRARFNPLRSTRVAGVVGARLLSFKEVRGFDALLGAQDVAIGIQVALAGGLSSGEAGSFLGADVYAGAGSKSSFVALRWQWEGQKREGGDGWVDALASGRLAWYWKPAEKRTLITSAEYAGAWRERIPYQLPLGRQNGVRGYRDSRVVGARRAVLRAEQRWVLGNVTRLLGVGVAGFTDVGKMWAGDVPFGVTSGVRASAGAGILAAVPHQSRRLLRLDVAVPLMRDRHAASYDVRFTASTPVRTFWREPSSIAETRSVTPPVGIFAWP
ncbi:MAG: hypothetical protein H7Z74_05965 [Anaerolineae bacterium]|nr:hypothetical protein [Gemmatimonadaceae bacterium]